MTQAGPAPVWPRPILCLVTDRRRLAERLGVSGEVAACEALVAQAGAAARAGVTLVQLREPDLPARALADVARRIGDAIAGTGARLVVNDRIDVALAAGAAGVHLRGDSMATDVARALLPAGALVGVSIHEPGEAAAVASEGADYLVFGTVFATASKTGRALQGPAGLRSACAAAAVPVLAIGGVSAATAGLVAAAGAAGIAAIELFLPAAGATEARELQKVVQTVRIAFDSLRDVT